MCANLENACYTKVADLNSVDYLDIDFDTISHALTINAFRHGAPDLGLWSEKVDNHGRQSKVEVGVLANEKPTEPEELSLGGFLTVVGEDDKPSTHPDLSFSMY